MSIFIIGLLTAVIVPAAGLARDQAALVLCRTRLHNVGTGLHAYAADNAQALPVEPTLDNPHATLLACLKGYVDNAENFYCPAQRADDLRFSPPNVQAGRIGYFYYSCSRATGDGAVSTFLRWEVAYPRALRADGDGASWVLSDAWCSGAPTAHRGYKKGVNYLEVSGSVKMVTDAPRQAFK